MIQYDKDILKIHVALRYDANLCLYKYKFSWVFLNFHKKILNFDKKINKNRVHFRISEQYLNRGRSKTTKTIKLLCNSHFSHFWPKLVIFGSILDRVLKILETSYDKLDVLIQNFQSDYLNLQTSIFSFNCNILNEKIFLPKFYFLKIILQNFFKDSLDENAAGL